MILAKLKCKQFLSLLVILLLTVTIGQGNVFAATHWDCGDGCQAVMFGIGDEEVRTYSIWARAGDTLRGQFFSENSRHGIGFGIYNSAGRLISEVGYAAPSGGSDYVLYEVHSSDYFYVRALCGGISCNGANGSIEIWN